MLTALLFTAAATSAILVANALRRPVPPGKPFPPLWLPGMVVSELAPWLLVVDGLAVVALVISGSLGRAMGLLALALLVASMAGCAQLARRSWMAARHAGASPDLAGLWKFRSQLPPDVEMSAEIPYADGLTMTILRGAAAVGLAPALIYLHPGSWMRGRPGRQARALMADLLVKGWVVLDIRYPLSPEATFPDHLIGVKRAIDWAKTKGPAVGIDPGRVAIAGGSSGAHLAALAALTSGHSELQPGFEEADTGVIACAPHYGIYDLLVRNPTRYDWPFIAKHVMKAQPAERPDLYRLGSPIDLAHPDAPPFLVVHGEFDSVVLPAESRHFVEALAREGVAATYHEVPGGQHGFDAFSAMRGRAIGTLVAGFLDDTARVIGPDRSRPQVP